MILGILPKITHLVNDGARIPLLSLSEVEEEAIWFTDILQVFLFLPKLNKILKPLAGSINKPSLVWDWFYVGISYLLSE